MSQDYQPLMAGWGSQQLPLPRIIHLQTSLISDSGAFSALSRADVTSQMYFCLFCSSASRHSQTWLQGCRSQRGHGRRHRSMFIEQAKPDCLSEVTRRMIHTDIFTLIDSQNFQAAATAITRDVGERRPVNTQGRKKGFLQFANTISPTEAEMYKWTKGD